MHSHLTLHLVSSIIKILQDGFRPNFCSYPIKYALATLITIPEGQLLLQSFGNYLVYIELFEYLLQEELTIHYAVQPQTVFMLLTLEKNSMLYTQPEGVSESPGNCYYLSYNSGGNFQSTLPEGEHKILLLTIRPGWLIRNSKDLPQFQPLIETYLSQDKTVYPLAQCPIDKDINVSIKRIQQHDGKNRLELDSVINQFINRIINGYHKMLTLKHYTTKETNQRKAAHICNFIKANSRSKIVDDVSLLASQFNVSERVLLRITRKRFGKPLHEQVIEFRLLDALKQLLTSNMQVQDVAGLVGYNPNYFTKAFKKYFGIAPSDVSGICL